MRLAQLTAKALVGARGASKYVAALASGDMAPDHVIESRRATCMACPTRQRVRLPGMVTASDWCGEPLVETPTSCGCLCAGKTAVASEQCPQGKWK